MVTVQRLSELYARDISAIQTAAKEIRKLLDSDTGNKEEVTQAVGKLLVASQTAARCAWHLRPLIGEEPELMDEIDELFRLSTRVYSELAIHSVQEVLATPQGQEFREKLNSFLVEIEGRKS